MTRTDGECSPASLSARADAPARKSAAIAGYAHRHGRQAAGDESTALCVNTAFAYPYYILPILFPHKKSLGLSPAIFGIMQSVMHGVIVSRIAGDKYSPGFLASFFLHIPLGVTYIRALKAAVGLTRGDFTKSAAYTVTFAVIGSLARTSPGRTRTPRTVDQGTDGTARC